jgi:hypothetical protein
VTNKYGDQIIAGTLLQLRAEDGLKYVGVYHGDNEIAPNLMRSWILGTILRL